MDQHLTANNNNLIYFGFVQHFQERLITIDIQNMPRCRGISEHFFEKGSQTLNDPLVLFRFLTKHLVHEVHINEVIINCYFPRY